MVVNENASAQHTLYEPRTLTYQEAADIASHFQQIVFCANYINSLRKRKSCTSCNDDSGADLCCALQ